MERSSNSHEIIQFSSRTRIQFRLLEILTHLFGAYFIILFLFVIHERSSLKALRIEPAVFFAMYVILAISLWYDYRGRKKFILSRLKAEFSDLPQPAEQIVNASVKERRNGCGVVSYGGHLLQFVTVMLTATCLQNGVSLQAAGLIVGIVAGLTVGFWLSQLTLQALEESLTRQLQLLKQQKSTMS